MGYTSAVGHRVSPFAKYVDVVVLRTEVSRDELCTTKFLKRRRVSTRIGAQIDHSLVVVNVGDKAHGYRQSVRNSAE